MAKVYGYKDLPINYPYLEVKLKRTKEKHVICRLNEKQR